MLKDLENRYSSRKFHGRSYFSFAMVRWKLLQKENLKFPNSKLHTVPEKMLYHQSYSTDFKKLLLCWKTWKIGIWAQKFHGRSYFSFAMVRWKLFSGGKIRNFPLSSCNTVPEKMLYHQSYSTDFKKLLLCWKTWKIGIWAENFMGAAILVLQW